VETGQHIADGIVAHVPHMQLPRRIGEHGKTVVLGLGGVFDGTGGLGLDPVLLGGEFDFRGLVFFLHLGGQKFVAKREIITGPLLLHWAKSALCRRPGGFLMMNGPLQATAER